jgi:hypothetical protein
MSYMDVLVPGIWIMLRVDKVIYRYHGSSGGQPFYCPDEQAEPPVLGQALIDFFTNIKSRISCSFNTTDIRSARSLSTYGELALLAKLLPQLRARYPASLSQFGLIR